MASLLSAAEKSSLDSVISESLFDTFKQTITVHKRPSVTVISTDPNHNFIMGDYKTEQIENVPQSQSFDAIIKYLKNNNDESFLAGQTLSQERWNESKLFVRIKVKIEAYEYLKDSINVELDGRLFKVNSSARQHGLFARSIYSFLLEEIK